MPHTVNDQVAIVMVRFRVRGIVRFLSHAETLRVLHRACARAKIEVQYTQGFNPRPRMSLPLPRPVGVESDDELLSLRVRCDNGFSRILLDEQQAEQYKAQVRARLSEQLPDGFEVFSVDLAAVGSSFQPRSVTYLFSLSEQYLQSFGESLKSKALTLMDSRTLNVDRRVDEKGTVRRLDVRPFLKSVEVRDKDVVAQCFVTPTGSIRVDEILALLELDPEELSGPSRRISVEWQKA